MFRVAFERAQNRYCVPGPAPDADAVFGAMRSAFFAEGVYSIGDLREELRRRPPIQMLASIVFPTPELDSIEGVALDGPANPIRSVWGGASSAFPPPSRSWRRPS